MGEPSKKYDKKKTQDVGKSRKRTSRKQASPFLDASAKKGPASEGRRTALPQSESGRRLRRLAVEDASARSARTCNNGIKSLCQQQTNDRLKEGKGTLNLRASWGRSVSRQRPLALAGEWVGGVVLFVSPKKKPQKKKKKKNTTKKKKQKKKKKKKKRKKKQKKKKKISK